VAQTTLIFLFLLGSYYLFFLKPQLTLPNKLNSVEKTLSEHHTTLLQNRLGFFELTKLDPNSANFNIEKSNLVGTLQKTNKEGLEAIDKAQDIPNIDKELSKRYKELLSETRKVYETQNKLLEKVFATNSYEAGVKVLKSEEAVLLLTSQTNLLLEYNFWLERINKSRAQLTQQNQ